MAMAPTAGVREGRRRWRWRVGGGGGGGREREKWSDCSEQSGQVPVGRISPNRHNETCMKCRVAGRGTNTAGGKALSMSPSTTTATALCSRRSRRRSITVTFRRCFSNCRAVFDDGTALLNCSAGGGGGGFRFGRW